MSDFLLGETRVLSGKISLPRIGVWIAELQLDTDTLPSGAQTLTAGDLTLVGNVIEAKSALFAGYAEVRLVGGSGQLGKLLSPRYYSSVTIRNAVSDIIRETGDTLSSTADASVLNTQFELWCRNGGEAGNALASLLTSSGASWRILPDGTLWIGNETWTTVDLEVADQLAYNSVEACSEIRIPVPSAVLLPGTTYLDRRVSYVEYSFSGAELGTKVWFEPVVQAGARENAPRDRSKDPLDLVVRNVLRRTFNHAMFPARVVGQDSDFTLHLEPDSPLLPQMVKVPIRAGSPGHTVKVANGARVLIAFEGGDPAKPIATLFDSAALNVSELREYTTSKITLASPEIKLGDYAARGVARMDDTTTNGTIAVNVASVTTPAPVTTILLTYTSPAGSVSVVPIILAGVLTGSGGGSLSLSGKIDSASSKVKAE